LNAHFTPLFVHFGVAYFGTLGLSPGNAQHLARLLLSRTVGDRLMPRKRAADRQYV
jgi:hypothetical protein